MKSEETSEEFLVDVKPIREALKKAGRKLRSIAQQEAAKKPQARRQEKILKKCFDDLGNFEWE